MRHPHFLLWIKLPSLQHREAAEAELVERIVGEPPAPYGLLAKLLGSLGLRWGKRQPCVVVMSICCGVVSGSRLRCLSERSIGLRNDEVPHESCGAFATGDGHEDASASGRLGRRYPDAAPLFSGPKGGPMRQSAAARMILLGASPKAIQSIMGHRQANHGAAACGSSNARMRRLPPSRRSN